VFLWIWLDTSSQKIFYIRMPLQREHLQFAVLFLCVPIQYLAVEFMGSSEVSRTYAISQLVDELYKLRSQWLSIEPWRKWCFKVLDTITEHGLGVGGGFGSYGGADSPEGESPAIEVLKFREKNGYFGQSPDIRDPKNPAVIYRVGQVVKHKKWGYHGVIMGWDNKARTPDEWLKEMHGENTHWRDQPNYAVLVDTRDRPAPQMTYVPQENIEVIKNKKILHPRVDDYFENYDGAQYLPRPWLRALYPRD